MKVINSNLEKIQLFSELLWIYSFFFRNFFELLCYLSETAAEMRTSSAKISEKIRRSFFRQGWLKN